MGEGRYLVIRMPNGRLSIERSEWEHLMGRWDASTAMLLVHMVRLIETQWSWVQQVNVASPVLLDQFLLARVDMSRYIRLAVELGDDSAAAIQRPGVDCGTREKCLAPHSLAEDGCVT